MKRLVALALALAAALAPSFAVAAAPSRPFDAPKLEADRARIPPAPPEYITQDEGWLRVVYHPTAREAARALVARANLAKAELTALLGRDLEADARGPGPRGDAAFAGPVVELRVAAARAELARLSPVPPLPAANVIAFSTANTALIVTSLGAPSSESPNLEAMLRHGLAHVALDRALGDHAVPRWFHEGFAVAFAGEGSATRAEALMRAALRDRFLSLAEVEDRFPAESATPTLAYAEATDFVRFLMAQPKDRLPAFVEKMRAGEELDASLAWAFRTDVTGLQLAWSKDMARRYSFLPVLAAATLLWAMVAMYMLMRRSQRRKGREEAQRERPSRVITVRPALRDAEGDEIGMIVDPEVPKVEHDGSWHTLH